jgi:hypothetical protein
MTKLEPFVERLKTKKRLQQDLDAWVAKKANSLCSVTPIRVTREYLEQICMEYMGKMQEIDNV